MRKFKLEALTLPAFSLLLSSNFFAFGTALGVDGLKIAELPLGSEVVIPGDFSVFAHKNQDTILTGMQYPQAITISSADSKPSVVQVFSKDEKRIRELQLKPGTNTI
jgi:hypothetical protein